MKQLTIDDVADAAGGFNKINQLGQRINNRYLRERVDKWIGEKLDVAHGLNLHQTNSTKKLLDIGTGAGWFPFICKLYGHNCIGTDISGRPEYDPVYEFFNIPFTEMLVHPFKSMPLTEKYDYITAMRAFFPQRPRAWEKNEWQYFFKDARKHLNTDGALYISANSGSKHDKRYNKLPNDQKSHWGNLELKLWFDPYIIKYRSKKNTLYITYNNIEQLLND